MVEPVELPERHTCEIPPILYTERERLASEWAGLNPRRTVAKAKKKATTRAKRKKAA